MHKIALVCTLAMIMSINTLAVNLKSSLENNQTVSQIDGMQNLTQEKIEVKSVRNILGNFDPMEHTKGNIRMGYITFSEDGRPRSSAYALGGHFHINSKRWNGLKLGAAVYTVLNLGINQNSQYINPDFFNEDGKSFILFSKAFLDGKWNNTEIKLGRQSLDTPHADSDDIRMMPNFFTAYTISNSDVDNLTLSAGLINKMAGWENGVDSAKFIDVGETLGVNDDIDGIYYAAANYEGIKNISLSLWYYHYSDIANLLYAEAGYNYIFSENTTLTLGLQYDASWQTGVALLGKQDAQTYGISLKAEFTDLGVTVLSAYNEDNSKTGATGLSLGGGPFFTSMEDQTLDATGAAGKAWMIGAAYNFENQGIDNLIFGVAYGKFEADNRSVYHATEFDAVLEYNFNEKISLTAAFSSIDHKISTTEDYNQFRLIANYNF